MNGFLIGFIGTILGLLLGLLFCLNINEIKSLLEMLLGLDLFSEEIYFFSNLPILIDYYEIFTIISLSLLLSFLATIYPSYKASKVQPISLIKWE
jgi:ABC-type transport system, involved in lipoprotein release, permease component